MPPTNTDTIERRFAHPRCIGVLLLLVLASVGCGASATKEIVERTIVLRPSAKANKGRHFFVMVRAVSETEFFADSYQKVASMVYPASKDPSVLFVRAVWPGQTQKLVVKVPGTDSFAVYALFTSPGDPWKVLVTPPLRTRYELRLGDRTIRLEGEKRKAAKGAAP
jgi:hypothetical protein